ncbi:MAG: tRNA (N(6)-L-threonylcarbamoyladenosine(37)-C(2))-methylthiotransferase MtaB [Ignavibacteria bacterium]|nr:tRNA (N(6)-L-threonylcarbamoyladenosine(37)-C(2))-methylthiotransferase MtaB [Ignavibacteria bacterium]
MKVSFYNLGCKVNFAELSQIQKQFEQLGAEIVEFGEPCDTVIINTCTVTAMADADCRKIIRRAQRISPNAFIAVTGCLAQTKPEEIAKISGVDAIFGTKYKFDIPILIEKFEKFSKPKIFVSPLDGELPYHSAISVDNESRTRVVLKIQDGCDYPCTYCIIPKARGKSRSMPFDALKEKILELDKSEYEEIVISGINVGEYKDKSGKTFVDVVRLIEEIQPKQRYRISSIEPNKLTKEIIDIISKSKIFCPHFHIPLQSGSDEILKSMRRRYNRAKYQNVVYEIKEKIPNACIGVDVITGFPGEDDLHFEETLTFLESLPISYLHVFTYSDRPGTIASGFAEKVPHEVKKERTRMLRKLSELKRRLFYEQNLGSVFTVIPEEYNSVNGRWKGWTENYIRCEFEGSNESNYKRVPVFLQSIQGDSCFGKVVDKVS